MRPKHHLPDPDLVRDLARRLPLRSGEDLDELVQEVWLRLLRHSDVQRTSPAWITGVARNVVRERRRQGPARRFHEEVYASGRSDLLVAEEHERQEGLEAVVDELFRELPDVDRALLRRRILDRASLEELASEFGLAPRAVKGRIRAAKERLRARRTLRGSWAALLGLPLAWRDSRRLRVALPAVAGAGLVAAVVMQSGGDPALAAGDIERAAALPASSDEATVARLDEAPVRAVVDLVAPEEELAAPKADGLRISVVDLDGAAIPGASVSVVSTLERTKVLWGGYTTRADGAPVTVPAYILAELRDLIPNGGCCVRLGGPTANAAIKQLRLSDLDEGHVTLTMPERIGPLRIAFETASGEPLDVPVRVQARLEDDWGLGRLRFDRYAEPGGTTEFPFTDLDTGLRLICRAELGWADERVRVEPVVRPADESPRGGRDVTVIFDEPEALIRGTLLTADGRSLDEGAGYAVSFAGRENVEYFGKVLAGGRVEFSVPYRVAAGEVADLVLDAGPEAGGAFSVFMPDPQDWNDLGSFVLPPQEDWIPRRNRKKGKARDVAPVERLQGTILVPKHRDPYRLYACLEVEGSRTSVGRGAVTERGRFKIGATAKGPYTLVVRTRPDSARELVRAPLGRRPAADAELVVDLTSEPATVRWELPAVTPTGTERSGSRSR